MIRSKLKSSKGLTLVELLVSLSIFSLITAIMIGYLISSMNNFKRVNEEIALHDEANYVMSEFVNYIFVATKVEVIDNSKCSPLIRVTNYHNEQTTLGFKNNQAVINNEVVHPSTYRLSCVNPDSPMIEVQGDTAKINLLIQNETSKYGKKLELNSDVSFVSVN